MFSFLLFMYMVISLSSSSSATNLHRLQDRYSKCQLFGICDNNIELFDNVSRYVQIPIEINGKDIYINASSSLNRFVQAKDFCEAHQIASPVCAPSIGRAIGDMLYCRAHQQFKYRFRFIRSSEYDYTIEFDLLRDILVNNFGWVECNESNNIHTYDTNLWIFDAPIEFLPRHVTSNTMDRLFSLNSNIGNKLVLRRHMNQKDNFMPLGFQLEDIIGEHKQNRASYISFLKSKNIWMVKNPILEGGTGIVGIFNNHSKLTDFILNDIAKKRKKHYILEEYVYPPYLLAGKKFSIGIYVVITSIDPLIVWVCNDEILVLLAIEEFNDETYDNFEMHLTNGVLLKKNKKYEQDRNLWSTNRFKEYVGIETYESILKQAKVIISNVVANFILEWRQDELNHASFGPSIYGFWRFDFLIQQLDVNYKKAYLIEVETLPSTAPRGAVDDDIAKRKVLRDMLRLAGWHPINQDIDIIMNLFEMRYNQFLQSMMMSRKYSNNIISDKMKALRRVLYKFNQQLIMETNIYRPLFQEKAVWHNILASKIPLTEYDMAVKLWYKMFHT